MTSRFRPLRVGFQLAIYVALTAHIASWYVGGQRVVGTVSPNGLFYLLQAGTITAGVLLTVGALLASAVLGNAFCGWACHFGALQDAAHATLLRLGVRPLDAEAPLRLRAVLLLKMLVLNTLGAWAALGELPTVIWALDAPEPCYAIGTWLTVALDIGVLALGTTWILGHRGFCRQLCPVILLFRPLNRYAPARMRLSGACVSCGACDRACPMNNPVKASLATLGSVASADCVRCGRCVDACPKRVLHFGLGDTPADTVERSPSTAPLAISAWGLAGLPVHELLRTLTQSGALPEAFSRHLPGWSLFYVALGLLLGSLIHHPRPSPHVTPSRAPRRPRPLPKPLPPGALPVHERARPPVGEHREGDRAHR